MGEIDKNWENSNISIAGKQIEGVVTVAYDGDNKSIYDTKVYETKREDGATVIILEKKVPMGHYENRKFMTDPIALPYPIYDDTKKELITSIIKDFETSINEQLKSPN